MYLPAGIRHYYRFFKEGSGLRSKNRGGLMEMVYKSNGRGGLMTGVGEIWAPRL